ncbi:hypothetical protein I3U44_17165 [Mycobacteroides abscessus subsp. bolletii]|uniref:hypothetical protein n=1 Tax=Mycobacteroides abscessus TaxID=36809 RepID=UPI0019D1158C|nr:hypothetical protein [Mycobacteroides abscessus]QSM87559.1 hypothetical protein I3U44_17165 [Mycobacteroides abscessus subsp. bolletii]
MKLAENMRTMADELTRQGYIVLSPNVHKGGSTLANPTPISDVELDQMHRVKIDMADLVVFVTQERRYVWGCWNEGDGEDRSLYFGESTTAELEYARKLGKEIKAARMIRRDYKDTIEWLPLDQLPSTEELNQ